MPGEATTPAGNHLFQVNPNGEKLDEDKAEFFHHNVAKLLFLCKQARPDIQTAVSFLCTRVKSPDCDDYKKLGRTMRYLRATPDIVLVISANDMTQPHWWVEGVFAVHDDMRSHTRGVLSFGGGAAYATSTKQKLNTKSSTEAELVPVDDMMGQILWTSYFLKA